MAYYQFYREQVIPAELDKVWDFISSPQNLEKITPDYMGFEIKSQVPDKMYPGMIITYRVSPVLGIKTDWVTEITQVRENEFFIDEQRVGPYKLWHHQHHIEEVNDGVLMKDIITYQPPFGLLGQMANALFIKKQLNGIFDFRKLALIRRFGEVETAFTVHKNDTPITAT